MTDKTVWSAHSEYMSSYYSEYCIFLLLLLKVFITQWTEREEKGVLSALNTEQDLR